MKENLKTIVQFITNPRLLLCWGIAWIITNGWSYLLLAIATYFDITWLQVFAGGYVTFLWLPISPEKIATAAIALVLLRFLFPNDQKTLAVLRNIYNRAKSKITSRKRSNECENEDHS